MKTLSLEIIKKMPMFQNDPVLFEHFTTEYREAQKVGRRKNYDLPKTPENMRAANDYKAGRLTSEQFLDAVGIKKSVGATPEKANYERARQYAYDLL